MAIKREEDTIHEFTRNDTKRDCFRFVSFRVNSWIVVVRPFDDIQLPEAMVSLAVTAAKYNLALNLIRVQSF